MTMPSGTADGLTIKELILQVAADVRAIDGKLDGFIGAHAAQHAAEGQADATARADTEATAVGRQLKKSLDSAWTLLRAHEQALQRVYGALALIGVIGGITFVTMLVEALKTLGYVR